MGYWWRRQKSAKRRTSDSTNTVTRMAVELARTEPIESTVHPLICSLAVIFMAIAHMMPVARICTARIP